MKKNIIYYLIAIAGFGVTTWYILHNPNVRQPQVEETQRIDPRLASYVEEWKQDMWKIGFDPTQAIASLTGMEVTEMEDKLGNTQHYAHRIEVSTLALQQGDAAVRATVYHELGHYVFGLEHGSCDLMAEKSLPVEYYESNWDEMKKEYIRLIRSQNFETHYGQ